MRAAEIAKVLGGRRHGHQFMAKCPAHHDGTPSLAIRDSASGKILLFCHGGCEQSAVIAALRKAGLWDTTDRHVQLRVVDDRFDADDATRRTAALKIWNETTRASGTPVDVYLRARGIVLPIPPSIRFHNHLPHHPTGTAWPCMVSLIVDVNGAPVAIHRIWLALDGKGKAPIVPAKMTLGSCRHGAVRLGEIKAGETLAISEGVETGLSVAQACRMPVWAALSADGVKNVRLPQQATAIVLCADHDANGVGEAAAKAARKRLLREGRRVRIAMPTDVGDDFNDLLLKPKESNRHVG